MDPQPLSHILRDIAASLATRQTVTVRELLEDFHERGFGFFLFLIALPAALPLPALGINTLIALPLLLLTGQQMMGRRTIWLPEKLKKKTLSIPVLQRFMRTALPWVQKTETLIRPRLAFITHGFFSYIIGVSGFIMALSVTLPVPLTNTVPSMGICLMALGVLMRDGLAVMAGMIVGLGWVCLLVTAFLLFGIEGLEMVKTWIKSFL